MNFGSYLCFLSLAIKAALTLTTWEPSTPVLPDARTTDNTTETTVTATTTNSSNTQPNCYDSLRICKETFNSDKKREQVQTLVNCVQAVKCDNNPDEVAQKHHTLMESKNDALHRSKDDDEGKNRALKGNAGLTMTLIISLAALKVNNIWKPSS